MEINATKTIQIKQNGITLSHIVGSKKQKVCINIKGKPSTSVVTLDRIDEVIELLKKMKTAAEVA